MQRGTYLVNSKTHEKIAVNGCRRSDKQPYCQSFGTYVKYQPDELPRIADLRPYMPQVENQRKTLTCVANALAGAYEYLLRRGANNTTEMSRLFIYYNGRARDPVMAENLAIDNGCYITDAIQALQQYGTCDENNWPFQEESIPIKPDEQAYQEAQKYTILEYNDVEIDLNKMTACLAQGFPFIFAMDLFRSIGESENNGGMVRYPDANEIAADTHYVHAMLAVGYIEDKEVFIVRNSWGTNWGDRGYLYIPYRYMTDPKYVSEAYVVKKFSKIELGDDHWKNDISQLEFQGPNTFGASAAGIDGDNDWNFEAEGDGDDGQNEDQ